MAGKLGASLVALVFALPFGAVGAFASYGIATMVGGSFRANDWVLVQAKVDNATLVASRGKSSTAYAATGAYRYTVAGKEYVSDRLGFMPFGGADNVGDWQPSMAAFLESAKSTGRTVPVYVNPDDPAESVVDPDIRWSMVLFMGLFAVLFGGVGIGGIVALGFIWFGSDSKGSAKSKRGRKDVKAHAAERNRAAVKPSAAAFEGGNPDAIPSTTGSSLVGLWVFTIVWNLIAFPIALLVIPQVLDSGEWLALLVLIFPLLGVLMLWGSVSQTIGRMRRGKATLVIADKEPRMGGRLSGTVQYPRGDAGKDFELRFLATQTQRGGESTSVVPRWWRDLNARSAADPRGGIRIAFQFDIPSRVDAPGVDAGDEAIALRWCIQVKPRGAANPSDDFEIRLQRARGSVKDLPMPEPTAESRSNDAAIAKLFGASAAAQLTPEQRASFAQMSPKTQSVVAWIVKTFNRRKP